ncbi:putative Glc8 protein [Seiridium unicorne]|uniref:Glc8 protein n=1 Tax=Seiridium unicorne TaxID=138068 RepID=A0ABR2VHK7_9PEZI
MEVQTSPPAELHSPPPPTAKRPRGILKNSFRKSPPVSPTKEKEMNEKDIVLHNTQTNAGHRRSSSAASRPAGPRRQSERTPSTSADQDPDAPPEARLKWDEANLYLTEQERTSTMKITEPKTPYAKHYSPSEDDDDEDLDGSHSEIPGLSLGEPEEEVPEDDFAAAGRKQSKVHVSDEDATPLHDADADMLGMTAEEREKHRRFEELRKKHYEMSEAVGLLGHPEVVDEEMEDDDDDDDRQGEKNKVPPVPKIPSV